MRAKIIRAIATSIATCAIALTACSRETQQQKFIEAMNHGNSAQASQIWLHMDARSREDFAHSQGMHPDLSGDDVKKQVMKHYQDQMGGDEDSGETIEKPTPNVHLGGLETLPEWTEPTGAPPQAVTVPTKNEPAN